MSLNICAPPRLPWTGAARLAPLGVRATAVGAVLEESTVDIVALQEVWSRRALRTIRRSLASYPFVAWHRGLRGQPAGGLVTLSRLPIGRITYHSYRGARVGKGGIGLRVASALNTALQGVLVAEVLGLGSVANTHLSANRGGDWSVGNRYESLQQGQLAALHRAVPRDVLVVAGDFNTAADSALYPELVGTWRDPFARAGFGTYQSELLPPGAQPHRIDYVLIGGDPAAHPIIHSGLRLSERLPGVGYASDHVALVVTLGAGED